MLGQALEEALAQPSTLILRGQPQPLAEWSAALANEFLPGTMVLAIPDGVAGLPPALDKPGRPAPGAEPAISEEEMNVIDEELSTGL